MPDDLHETRNAANAFAAALHDQGVRLTVDYYGCCACQQSHFEGEPLYEPHKWRQSKHGVRSITAAQYATIRRQSP